MLLDLRFTQRCIGSSLNSDRDGSNRKGEGRGRIPDDYEFGCTE